ncbi:hypothetical protein PLANPX_1193 [Lacipirellula parvula]|uniref:Secreted protein n=1 Tax=Lacipirellula parvula TaxID=2650471 RepID=A0A5K7XA05_9BACT|nr:hypothetical protein PLANPX_1193 [Lacipirellula parvula]
MKSLATITFAVLATLLAHNCANAQSTSAVGPRGNLRSRLPFSSPGGAAAGQMSPRTRPQPTGGAVSFMGNYAAWAGNGYLGAGTSSAQPYQRGRGPMLPQQQRSVNGIGANDFNPANPNAQQGQLTGQQDFDGDYGWMDVEPAAAGAQREGAASSAGGSPSNDTANATNVQGYTGAAVPGADQVATPSNAARPVAQAMNQQASEWRFYQTPLMDRVQTQQSPQTAAPTAPGVRPAQGQQPTGVAETATGDPIKY